MNPIRCWRRFALLLLTTLGGAGAVAAQDPGAAAAGPLRGDTLVLTLAGAQRLAAERNPAILSRRRAAEAATGRLRQARVYPYNPEVSLRSAEVGSGRTWIFPCSPWSRSPIPVWQPWRRGR